MLWEYFRNEASASAVAKESGMHIATVLKYYHCFRKEIAAISDSDYKRNTHLVTDYDEYLYLPKTLSAYKNPHHLRHFLTLAYSTRVYSLMMPTLPEYGIMTDPEKQEHLMLKYLQFSKVAKLSTSRGIIVEFWEYFEEFITRFRGVGSQQFAYYLKEAEWRFNGMPQIDPVQCLHH